MRVALATGPVKNANPVFRPASRVRPIRAWRLSARRRSVSQALAGLLFVAAPVFTLAGCGAEEKKPVAATAEPKTVADYFPIAVGDKIVRMQLAVRSGEMQRGLMERRDLGRDDGMIFIYEKPQQMSFWMRNTPTPLDIGFFSRDGVLAEVYPLHPFDETTVASRSDTLQFALEMNQGWFRANTVKPGAKLDLKALAAALKARGFEAKRFGLGE